MSATVSLTESDALTVLRAFLLDVLLDGTEVIKGQVNRVPQPVNKDYVVMTAMLRDRLSTNVDLYNDVLPIASARYIEQSTQVTVQLDIHGPQGTENSQILSTLLRSGVACDEMAKSGFGVQPLYASTPRQMPFINGEMQYEDRWTVDAALQFTPVVALPQQFAGEIEAGLYEVDTTYPA